MTTEPRPALGGEPPVRSTLRLVWLVGLVYAVASAAHPGAHGRHLAATILTVTTGLGWSAWLVARSRKSLAVSGAGIVVLACSGGALVVLNPIGVAVIAIAGLCAASLLELTPAAALTAPGVVATAVAVAGTGHNADVIINAASGAVAGIVVGVGRRQGQQRILHDAELALARERAEVEEARTEVLAERNRVAREVHDVLAHTLSALAVQLEAAGSLLDEDAPRKTVAAALTRSRRLAVEGLDETRRAVHVLRDEPVDLVEQIATLANDGDVSFVPTGSPRPLPPATGLALLRVAQEAVTNARKHAAGGAVTVSLSYLAGSVELTVGNTAGRASTLAATGSGYGINGMRERIEIVGGTLDTGPYDGGWRVHATVPT